MRKQHASSEGVWLVYDDSIREVPRNLAVFQTLPKSRRRDFVLWISAAKRPEARAKRIAESIRLLAAGKPLGLK